MQGSRAIKMHVGLPDPNKDVERVSSFERCWVPISYCWLMQRN